MVSSAAIAGDAQSIAVPKAAAVNVFSNLSLNLMSNPSCIYFCLMQREGAVQSLCQIVNSVLTPQIIQSYQMIGRVLASLAAAPQPTLKRRV
jgi:hypothetical protein